LFGNGLATSDGQKEQDDKERAHLCPPFGEIVAVSTGDAVSKEMIAAAVRDVAAGVDRPLGNDAARVMPERPSLVQWLARRNRTSVDDVLTRKMQGVACAAAEEIASHVAGFEITSHGWRLPRQRQREGSQACERFLRARLERDGRGLVPRQRHWSHRVRA